MINRQEANVFVIGNRFPGFSECYALKIINFTAVLEFIF